MRIAVVGSGYVGLVVAASFADTGNDVVCADVDAGRVRLLSGGVVPIFEPGLEEMVRRNLAEGRLRFTGDVGSAVEHGKVVFIAVGTPSGEDGSADLQHVLAVARTIAAHLNEPKVVVTKSTVPVGTSAEIRRTMTARTDRPFFLAASPEFLKEGTAIADFTRPDRVIIGADSPEARDALAELYEPYVRSGNPILFMDIASAELTKYAANAMLASRISFMNQMADLCERVGADVFQVRRGIAADKRIGGSFLLPGPGFGGSCLPKDLRALIRTAHGLGMGAELFEAIEAVNQRQLGVLLGKVRRRLGDDLGGRRLAVWGLAFKAGTDDMRESPAIPLVEGLLAAGAEVRAHDPEAGKQVRAVFGDRIVIVEDPYEAADGADALVIVTEWMQYRTPDFDRLHRLLRRPLVIDGRNLYDPDRMTRHGFEYVGIGRGEA